MQKSEIAGDSLRTSIPYGHVMEPMQHGPPSEPVLGSYCHRFYMLLLSSVYRLLFLLSKSDSSPQI
jgi:hypothetical protein